MGTQLNRIITNETGDTKLNTTSTREDTIKIKQEDTHTQKLRLGHVNLRRGLGQTEETMGL